MTSREGGRCEGEGGARRSAGAGARPVGAETAPVADGVGRSERALRGVNLVRAAAGRRARDQRAGRGAGDRAGTRDRGGRDLRRIVHVSTAYVSGRHAGEFGEGDLEVGQEFRNTYECSKYEAERLLRGVGELPLAIARPSIVVGHSASGWTSAFNVLYWPMRALERGLLRRCRRADSIWSSCPSTTSPTGARAAR